MTELFQSLNPQVQTTILTALVGLIGAVLGGWLSWNVKRKDLGPL